MITREQLEQLPPKLLVHLMVDVLDHDLSDIDYQFRQTRRNHKQMTTGEACWDCREIEGRIEGTWPDTPEPKYADFEVVGTLVGCFDDLLSNVRRIVEELNASRSIRTDRAQRLAESLTNISIKFDKLRGD